MALVKQFDYQVIISERTNNLDMNMAVTSLPDAIQQSSYHHLMLLYFFILYPTKVKKFWLKFYQDSLK